MSLFSELKELCTTPSISGREAGVCKLIKGRIEGYVDSVSVDALGNLIAHKKGKTGEKRIMLCAHMDEIGFLVNFIEDNGYIRVATIGGIHTIASAYGSVVSEKGVLGALVVEGKTAPADYKADKLYIDIGASSKKEAEKKVRIGDFFVCTPSLQRLGSSRVVGRPLDDRVGCLVLLELAKRLKDAEHNADVYFVFSTQEEVGCRGSRPAAFTVAPHEAICFDVTATGDEIGSAPMACALGKGVAIKVKDSSVICHETVVNALVSLADENRIPAQKEILLFGGTDTSSMQLSAGGAMVGALSIPSRYIHTGVEVCDMKDVKACIDLAEKYILARG